jgi:predicted acetyltransferase
MYRLVEPSIEYKDSFIKSVSEFNKEGKYIELSLDELRDNFEEFLLHYESQRKGADLPKGYVPMTTYWLVDDDEYIGRVSLRHKLSGDLERYGGHIGYEIRPSRRKEVKESVIFELAIPLTEVIEADSLLLVCDGDDIGARKVIEENGGNLADTFEHDGKMRRRYWITKK